MNILFLGDSITDCGHCFTPDGLGNGYVKLISDALGRLSDSGGRDKSCETKWHVVNGGMDGFTFPRIFQKWKRQYAGEQFDIISILGGINEVGAIMDSGLTEAAVRKLADSSEQALYLLLRRLSESGVRRILLLEPFVFPYPAYLMNWIPVLEEMRGRIRNAADMAGASGTEGKVPISLIPLQPALDACAQKHGCPAVTIDGIHLTEEGHRILCDRILPYLLSSAS